MSTKRVVITGLGAVTPIGNNVADFWQQAQVGASGAAAITRFDASKFKTQFACEIKDFNPLLALDRKEIKRCDLFTQFALYAASEALTDSGLDYKNMDPYEIGVIWGVGQGGMETFEEQVKRYLEEDKGPRFNPFFIPKMLVNMAAGMISLKFGLQGINYTTASACATSNSAIMDAYNYIKWGKGKVFVTGGSEAPITEASIGGFNSLKALSAENDSPTTACKPFDVARNGFVMGEGAGALILEEYEHAKQRGATIYAEIVGAAMTADAYHMTATHPQGLGAQKAMQFALREAELELSQVDYINAHATSTGIGDLSEITAIHQLFGAHQPAISATKSMTGHLLGAAGAIEAILSVKAIQNNLIPPTINTQNLDPTIPEGVDIVIGEARKQTVEVAMSNTFGFGGHNAIVVFKGV
jgi:3-oxoacyl-[acyl-carrier-protein] synthase II